MEQCSHQTLKSIFAVSGFTIVLILMVNLRTGLFLQSKDDGICVIRFVPARIDGTRQHECSGATHLCVFAAIAVINGK